jgi:hypothetical protein
MATTTPNYGWPVPTSTDYVKDGATAIEALGDAIDATVFGLGAPALKLVKKQTIGTTVSTVQVTSAFSSTYENYLIMVTGGVGSTTAELRLSLDGITTGYYSTNTFQSFGSTAVGGLAYTNQASWAWAGAGSTSSLDMAFLLRGPNMAKAKRGSSEWNDMGTGGTAGNVRHLNTSTTQATGFTITPASGSITGGTIYVYGYGLV